MRPGGGKAKGNGFESTVAKILGAALPPLKFIRTQGSGARVGGKNFDTIGQMFGADALKLFVGDVVPVNEREAGVKFKWGIETKFYKTPDPFPSLLNGKANIYKWMREAEEDSAKVGKQPLLIFKWNNTPIYCATSAWINLPYSNDVCRMMHVYADDATKPNGVRIALLEDMLKFKEFWYDGTPIENKENTNEPQESQSPPHVGPSDGEEGLDQGALDPLRNGQAG